MSALGCFATLHWVGSNIHADPVSLVVCAQVHIAASPLMSVGCLLCAVASAGMGCPTDSGAATPSWLLPAHRCGFADLHVLFSGCFQPSGSSCPCCAAHAGFINLILGWSGSMDFTGVIRAAPHVLVLAFESLCGPIQIGSAEMALPRLNALSEVDSLDLHAFLCVCSRHHIFFLLTPSLPAFLWDFTPFCWGTPVSAGELAILPIRTAPAFDAAPHGLRGRC